MLARPDEHAVSVNFFDAVQGHHARFAAAIEHLDGKMVAGAEADLPDSDDHDLVLHAIIVADPEIGSAKRFIPADAIQEVADGHHLYGLGWPSLMLPRIAFLNSVVSSCPCTAMPCWTAASTSSSSESAEIATVHLLSVCGMSLQSIYLRVMGIPLEHQDGMPVPMTGKREVKQRPGCCNMTGHLQERMFE